MNSFNTKTSLTAGNLRKRWDVVETVGGQSGVVQLVDKHGYCTLLMQDGKRRVSYSPNLTLLT